jgi:threonine/homoserine/homoserine lactone efflux protein
LIDTALILALTSYYIVMFVTPGPNNTMLTISGIKFGFKKTIPHIFGISIGHALQISIVCLGFGYIFQNYPLVQIYLKWVCLVYLFYLAWKMIGSIKNHDVNAGKPLKFIEASLFQWVNPKAWTIAITVSTAFYPSEENYIFAFLFLAFFASLVNLPCISLWALFGASLRKFIDNERIKKIIEYFFALLLVLTGIYLAIN